MKYKVGDKVKVREDLGDDKNYGTRSICMDMKKFRGEKVSILRVHDDCYDIGEDEGFFDWTDEMFEGLAEYTYEDLKEAPLGTKVTFENKNKIVIKTSENNLEDETGIIKIYNLKENGGCLGKIIKIEEPQYTTVYEAKDILDKKEREYLSNVIKPFKKKVECIKKFQYCDGVTEFIIIKVLDSKNASLPSFEAGTMYKGMEADREYSLKDLGLD